MPEGVNSVADMTVIVDASISEAIKGLESLEGIIGRIAGDGTAKLGFFDSKIGGLAGTVGLVAGRFNVWLQGAQALIGVFERVMGSAEKLSTAVGAEDQFENFRTAVDDLAVEVNNSFDVAMSRGTASLQALLGTAATADASGGNTGKFLDSVSAKATRAVRQMQALVGYFSEPEQRTASTLGAEIESIKREIAELNAVIAGAEARGETVAGLFAWGGGTLSLQQLRDMRDELQRQVPALNAAKEAKETLGPWDLGINVEGVDKSLDALKHQNEELAIRQATLGMSAGAAFEYAQTQKLMNEYGERWLLISEADRAQMIERIALGARITQALDDQRKAQQAQQDADRNDKRFDSDLQNAEREIAQMRVKSETVGMAAGAVAELTERQKLLDQARRDGINVGDEEMLRIKAIAAEYGNLVQAQDDAKHAMQELQEYGREFGSAMEQAFTSWIKTGKLDWDQFMNSLAVDIAKLALRQGVIQPLFGGGSTPGAGLFGSLFSGVFGGAKASGGPAQPGMAYQWNEDGKEFFVPDVSGTVVPASALAGIGAALAQQRDGGSRKVEFSQTVHIEGSFGKEEVAQIAEQYSRRGASAALAQAHEEMPARLQQFQQLGS